VKISAKIASDGRYFTFQLAEASCPGNPQPPVMTIFMVYRPPRRPGIGIPAI